MLAFDKNLFGTVRHKDENGFLHVDVNNITKATVNPYYGREIPNYKEMGFLPDEIYYGLRPADELEKGAGSFNNLPLLDHHVEDGAAMDNKKYRVGSLGDKCSFENPYLKNSLVVYDQQAINDIESGQKKELSCAYRYDPIKRSGNMNGQKYDFIMSNIRGNHIALVKEGRAGSDVVVADSNIVLKGINMFKKAKKIALDETIEEKEKAAENVCGEDEEEVAKDETEAKRKKLKELVDLLKTAGLGEDLIAAVLRKAEEIGDDVSEAEDVCGDEDEEEEEEEFASGVKYGEKLEKKEPKKLDSEHESKGMKQAMDSAVISAKEEVRNHYKKMAQAVSDVKGIMHVPDMFAFDSADDIYKKALQLKGIDIKGCSDFRGMVKVLNAQTPKVSMDSKSVKLDGAFAGLNNIRKA